MQRRNLLMALGMMAVAPLGRGLEISSPVEPLPKQPWAPDFDLLDLEGKHHRSADYKGRVLLINFWATWCPPCRAEMPSMDRMLEQWQGAPLALIAIAMGQNEKQVREYAEKNKHKFPLLPDPDGKVSEAFGVRGLPTSYILNTVGRMVFKVQGGREWDSERMRRTLSLVLPEA